MMYLVIKELSGIAEDVIMVTQSLIKDIQSKQDTVYRANAIRALCLITDVSVFVPHHKIIFLITVVPIALHDPRYRAHLESIYCG